MKRKKLIEKINKIFASTEIEKCLNFEDKIIGVEIDHVINEVWLNASLGYESGKFHCEFWLNESDQIKLTSKEKDFVWGKLNNYLQNAKETELKSKKEFELTQKYDTIQIYGKPL